VLIVADDATAREVYAELFAMRGYAVATASSAREGLVRAQARAIAVVVLAMTSGATQLRKRLLSQRPRLKIHVTGLLPLWLDPGLPALRQHLH
jgi:DNA-binding NtrC family response regulator